MFLDLINSITREQVDSPEFLPVRCPNKEAASRMAEIIAGYRDKQDSIGGTLYVRLFLISHLAKPVIVGKLWCTIFKRTMLILQVA